jgi:hypothetical protein
LAFRQQTLPLSSGLRNIASSVRREQTGAVFSSKKGLADFFVSRHYFGREILKKSKCNAGADFDEPFV